MLYIWRLRPLSHGEPVNEWKPFNKRKESPSGITLTRTKFELDLPILMMNLHTEFQFKMSMHNQDNEQKP